MRLLGCVPLVWVVTVLSMDLNSTLVTVSGLTLFKPLTVFFLSKLRRQNANFQNLVDLRDFHKKNSLKSQKLTTKNSIYINTDSNQSFNSCNSSFSNNPEDPELKMVKVDFKNMRFFKNLNLDFLYYSYTKIFYNNKGSNNTMSKKENNKWCYYINPMQDEQYHAKRGVEGAGGYVPSRVVENKAGHSYCSYPTPNDTLKLPWFWSEGFGEGQLEVAQYHCENANKELGLSKLDVARIVCSSMFHKGNDNLSV